jgi:hypothetical protein
VSVEMDRLLDKLRWIRTSRNETVQAQARLLRLGGVEQLVEAVDTTIEWTDHRGRQTIQTIHSLEGGDDRNPPLIYFPGYAAASGFIFRNLGQWIGRFSVKAVDFLGTGLSSRPSFRARTTREAEDFFIESFELWRRKRNIEKFTLVGHSMGGMFRHSPLLTRRLGSPTSLTPALTPALARQATLPQRTLCGTLSTCHTLCWCVQRGLASGRMTGRRKSRLRSRTRSPFAACCSDPRRASGIGA